MIFFCLLPGLSFLGKLVTNLFMSWFSLWMDTSFQFFKTSFFFFLSSRKWYFCVDCVSYSCVMANEFLVFFGVVNRMTRRAGTWRASCLFCAVLQSTLWMTATGLTPRLPAIRTSVAQRTTRLSAVRKIPGSIPDLVDLIYKPPRLFFWWF